MDAIAAITKSCANMSRVGKRDGFNVGRIECSIIVGVFIPDVNMWERGCSDA